MDQDYGTDTEEMGIFGIIISCSAFGKYSIKQPSSSARQVRSLTDDGFILS